MDFQRLNKALVIKLLQGKGVASHAHRRAAFDNAGLAKPVGALIDKIVNCAYKISDEDFDTVKKSGLSEDQIFELVVCAAVVQATRQYNQALKILVEVADDMEDSGYAP